MSDSAIITLILLSFEAYISYTGGGGSEGQTLNFVRIKYILWPFYSECSSYFIRIVETERERRLKDLFLNSITFFKE